MTIDPWLAGPGGLSRFEELSRRQADTAILYGFDPKYKLQPGLTSTLPCTCCKSRR